MTSLIILLFYTWIIQLSIASGQECVDDDTRIAQLAAANSIPDITGCIDAVLLVGCSENIGKIISGFCCKTCSEMIDSNTNTTRENELPGTDETIQIFLLSGQSECAGQAFVNSLENDSATYPDLQGDIDGVWFAGYTSPADVDRYFIAPMKAGVDGRYQFGPEISFGERIHSVTQKRTMIVKYCVGGTQVHENWNPTTADNSWDKSQDDGTSKWMMENAGLDFQSKNHLFKNMIYTIRLTEETLTDANIPFEWAGIVWIQGNGDKDEGDPYVWKTFGENTARVWEGFRAEIGGSSYDDDVVPIVDTGSSANNQLQSGKAYATQIVKGCNAINVEYPFGADDDTYNNNNPDDGGCIPGPSNPCFESPNMHPNYDLFNEFGWDPQVPDELKPAGFTDKTFHWWLNYPNNLHSAYEGMVLNGQVLANAYIREFVTDDDNITLLDSSSFDDTDPSIQYPFQKCADGTRATDDNICWIDYRDESLMIDVEKCDDTNKQ